MKEDKIIYEYASIPRRICANIIDALIVTIIIFFLLACFCFILLVFSDQDLPNIILSYGCYIYFFASILQILYFVVSWRMYNSTLGGELLSIKVFNEDYTKEIPIIRLILRLIFILFSSFIDPFDIGLIAMCILFIIFELINLMLIIFTEKSQALHDLVAKTIVVKTIKIKN
jgi:uncharacterized RDD family membrane protein YckC